MIPSRAWQPQIPEELSSYFRAEGLNVVGIAPAVHAPTRETEYQEWIENGRNGSMSYLADHAGMKFRPEEILPGCRSIIMVALNYYQEASWKRADNDALPESDDTVRGRIARYAWGRDYHKVIGKRLRRIARKLETAYPGESFRSFTDAVPLAERYYAERAGVGFTAKNTLTISSEFGSWFLMGEILSTREFPPSEDPAGRHGACPTNCTRCIDVCPTGALESPYRIDASKCISYLTIEHKGSIPEELRPKMGTWLFGCDLCQEVCPLNVRAQQTSVEDFVVMRAGESQDLQEILEIETDDEFRERFAGSPVMRAKRTGLLRNAAIVAANTGAGSLLPLLRRRAEDADAIIAEHAQWAVAVLEERISLRPGKDPDG